MVQQTARWSIWSTRAVTRLPSDGTLRVVVGHGSTDSLSPDPNDPALVVLDDLEAALAAGRVHYVALGDRHSTTEVGGTGRIWYSGAPGAHGLRRDRSRECPDRRSRHPTRSRSSAGRVGTWQFVRRDFDVTGTEDCQKVEHFLEDISDKARTIVKLSLVGQLSLADMDRLESALDHAADLLGALERWERRCDLVALPDDDDFGGLGALGVRRGRSRGSPPPRGAAGDDALTARDALGLLYRLARTIGDVMRIHRIKLGNYRGVSQSEVTFPVQGVTIIEGDNEIGKTSLSEAIDLLLAERDDSSKQRVKAVKPAHRDVGAEVEIELSTGPYRFVYRKRWHKQRETVLDILEPRRSQLTGREAHDKVRAILDETLDEALWDAFRLKQGAQLEQAAFAGGSLGRALDKAAGGDSDRRSRGRPLGAHHRRTRALLDRHRPGEGRPDGPGQPGLPMPHRGSPTWRPHSVRWTTTPQPWTACAMRPRSCRKGRTRRRRARRALAAQFEAIQSRRNDVARLEGLRDTALAQRDQLLGLSNVRAELKQRVVDTAAAVVEIESQVAGALPARQEVVTRLQHGAAGVRRREGRDGRGRDRPAAGDR